MLAEKYLSLIEKYNHEHYHYCDLDRLVTWCLKNKEEIPVIKNLVTKYDYLIIGRTKEAFETHPIEWQKTEEISNKIFSFEFGQEADITAGSCGMSKEAVKNIISFSDSKMKDADCL